jgi:hypothetical protein
MACRFCLIIIVVSLLTDINVTNLVPTIVPLIEMKAALASISMNREC